MSTVAKYFNEAAGSYNDKSSKGLWAFLRRLESVAVMKAVDPFQGMTCIELGCGAGFYISRLLSCDPSLLVAVDISENMLGELNDSRVKRVRADIENINFKVAFDRVLCAGVIEFLPDIKNFLTNLKTLLSVSGKAVLLMPESGVFGRFYRAFHRAHSVQVSLYKVDELEYLLEVNHLKIEKQYLPPPMTRVLVITHD